jgi:hypothetical protein
MPTNNFVTNFELLVEKIKTIKTIPDDYDLIDNLINLNNKSKSDKFVFKKIDYKIINDPIFDRINRNNSEININPINNKIDNITNNFIDPNNKIMLETLNFSDMFNSHQADCICNHKNNNGTIKTCNYQSRFLSLLNFVSNSSYWTRFNIDITNGTIINPDYVKGKYLNEIHNFYNKKGLYDNVYKSLLMSYFQLTGFRSLKKLYIDSSFVHNIMSIGADRNPQFYNKTGLKIHTLSDSDKIPIAIIITQSSVHDSEIAERLLDNLLIDVSYLQQYTQIVMADAAYATFLNIKRYTDLGLKIIFGMNKRYIKKETIIHDANENSINEYKTRHIVENLIADIKKYPIILNCFEKSKTSYRGLLLFVLSNIVCKRYNKYVKCLNDKIYKKQLEDDRIKRKEKDKLARIEKFKKLKEAEKYNEIKKQQEHDRINKLKEEVNDKIWNLIDKRFLRNKYRSKIKQYKIRINQENAKRGRPKDVSYTKFNNIIKERVTNHIKNNELTKTSKFITSYKKTTFIIEAPPFAFSDQTIHSKISTLDITDLLNKYTNNFFT